MKKMGTKSLHENDKQQKRKQQNKKQRTEKQNHRKKEKKQRIRIFPTWLRIIVIILLAAGALALGLMFGYGVIGDGSPKEVFERDTWQHIIDINTKNNSYIVRGG